jgi:hypothetical protein
MDSATRKPERGSWVSRCVASQSAVWMAAALLVGSVSSGCSSDDTMSPAAGSGGSNGGATGATFTQVLALFGGTPNCQICHALSPSSANGGLQFKPSDKAQAYGALVGPSSAGGSGSQCGGKKYVVAGNPSGSLLYTKLTSSPPCGVRMPMSGVPLTPDQLQIVSSWIMAGALND